MNSYTGITTISAGTISISADRNLGAVPGSVTATQLTLSGGILQTTASFTLATNRGITLSTGGGTINVDSGITTIYGGTISGTTIFTKDGLGTFVLTGTKTDTANPTYIVIKQGTYTVRSDSPQIDSQTFTGAGNLIIESVSTSFTTNPLDTLNIKLVTVTGDVPNSGLLGSLTVGKSGNLSTINISGNITTAGNQTFFGPVTLGTDITSTITSGIVRFSSTLDTKAAAATTSSLTISGGTLQLDGIVGGTRALNNITTTNGGSVRS